MQFIVKAYDGENMLDKRMEVRPRHLEGMKALGKQIICAGGLLDEEGKMKGSALVMEFESRAALDEYLKNEPYVRCPMTVSPEFFLSGLHQRTRTSRSRC